MRGCWRNFENKQAEKAIVGSACNPKRVSIGITLWLLTASLNNSRLWQEKKPSRLHTVL